MLVLLFAIVLSLLLVQFAADPATLANRAGILQRRYLHPYGPLLFSETVLLDKLTKMSRVAGRNRREGLKTRRTPRGPGSSGYGTDLTWDMTVAHNDSFGSRTSAMGALTGYMPDAGHASSVEASLTAAHYFGTLQLTAALLAANSPVEDAIDEMDAQVKSVLLAGQRALNIDLYGDGTGRLATITATTSSTTIYVSDWRYLIDRQGKRICIAVTSDGSGAIERIIGTVSKVYDDTHGGYPVTITVAANADATMSVYRIGIHNTSHASAWGNAAAGLAQIVSASTTYAGMDRSNAAYAGVRAQVPDAIAEDDWAPDALDDLLDLCRDNGADPQFIVCGRKFWQLFGRKFLGAMIWQNGVKRLDGKYPALFYDGLPLIKDRDCPDYKCYPIDPNQLVIGVEEELSLWDYDGQTWVRVSDSNGKTDAVEANVVTRYNVIAYNPAGMAVGEITPNAA